MRLSLLLLAPLAAAIPLLSARQSDSITILGSSVSGSGCPPGQGSSTVLDGGRSITVGFDSFTLSTDSDPATLDCTVVVTLSNPNNADIDVVRTNVNGNRSFQDGVSAPLSISFFKDGSSTSYFSDSMTITPAAVGEPFSFLDSTTPPAGASTQISFAIQLSITGSSSPASTIYVEALNVALGPTPS